MLMQTHISISAPNLRSAGSPVPAGCASARLAPLRVRALKLRDSLGGTDQQEVSRIEWLERKARVVEDTPEICRERGQVSGGESQDAAAIEVQAGEPRDEVHWCGDPHPSPAAAPAAPARRPATLAGAAIREFLFAIARSAIRASSRHLQTPTLDRAPQTRRRAGAQAEQHREAQSRSGAS